MARKIIKRIFLGLLILLIVLPVSYFTEQMVYTIPVLAVVTWFVHGLENTDNEKKNLLIDEDE